MKPLKLYTIAAAIIAVTAIKCSNTGSKNVQSAGNAPISKTVIIDGATKRHTIDGFGVNITPAQWRNGNLKPAIDSLVDDLGCTLFRFDCVGLADWIDPSKRGADGKYPADYLQQVYTNKTFSDAWATFKYLNSKKIIPQFNVSGRIPPAMGRKDDIKRLADFEGYAEMIATMLVWAREQEKLTFSILSPFNETDLGFPEGAKLEPEDVYPAVKAMVKKLDEYNLSDIKLVLMDDTRFIQEKLSPIISDTTLINRVMAFGTHSYGNGDEAEQGGWYDQPSDYYKMVQYINNSAYKGKPCWMTEYGDLDQTNEIEFEFAWRSTRRLLKFLDDGFSGAEAWDAFDNFHEHDTVWARYGLLKTDTTTTDWTYKPKDRYYTAKHVYKYVPAGWHVVNVSTPPLPKFDGYENWHAPLKNMRMLAFVSPDGKSFTLVGMSKIEQNVALDIELRSLGIPSDKPLKMFVTSRNQKMVPSPEVSFSSTGHIKTTVKEGTIFTVTTLE